MNRVKYNKLYKEIFKNEDKPISSYDELIDFLKEMKSVKPKFNKDIKNERRKTECYALSCGLLALALENKNKEIDENLKQYITVYATLLTNISNDCLAIVNMLDNGFEFQARILSRNLFELIYTLLVVIINKDKCREYFEAGAENGYEIWNKYFRVSKLNEELYNYEKQEDIELAEMMKNIRKKTYSEYSSYAHNDFIYCFIGCHSTDREKEFVNYNLWGNYNFNAISILESVNELLWMMFLYLENMISKKEIFEKSLFISEENHKYWNDAFLIAVMLDEYKQKE